MSCRVFPWIACVLTIVACGSCDSSGICPSAKPSPGSACDGENLSCEYLKEDCPCGQDLHYQCSCRSGAWQCGEDFDCSDCPCPGTPPTDGSPCKVGGPISEKTCDFAAPSPLRCVCKRSSPTWDCESTEQDSGSTDSSTETDGAAGDDSAADAVQSPETGND